MKNNVQRIIDRKQDLIANFYKVIEELESKTNTIELGDEQYSIICSITPDGYLISTSKNDIASKFIVSKMNGGMKK